MDPDESKMLSSVVKLSLIHIPESQHYGCLAKKQNTTRDAEFYLSDVILLSAVNLPPSNPSRSAKYVERPACPGMFLFSPLLGV